jgi:hypothetical protein
MRGVEMLVIVGWIVILVAGIVANLGVLGTASRKADTRRADARFRREMAFINRDRDARLEHQARADGSTGAADPAS